MNARVLRFLSLVVAATLSLSVLPPGSPVAGQEKPGRLVVIVKAADATLEDFPVMVSAIFDGRIVRQYETLLVTPPLQASVILDDLVPGEYDVRIEGDGIVTEVKRGVLVFSGKDGSLRVLVRPGQGVHIVEYAIGGLAREEVAARLQKLESGLDALQKAMPRP